MSVDLNDHIGFRYLMNGSFDPGFLALAATFDLGESDILLDIGANIGTECVSVAVRSGCEVIAIEASKFNAALLIQNAAQNDIRLRVHVVAVADSVTVAKSPWLDLQVNHGNTGANSIFEGWNPSVDGGSRERVPSTTLDAILTDDQIKRTKLAKIDIEGAEFLALSSANRLRAAGVPIAFEYLPGTADDGDLAKLVELLSRDYELHGTDVTGRILPFDPASRYENALALPKKG